MAHPAEFTTASLGSRKRRPRAFRIQLGLMLSVRA